MKLVERALTDLSCTFVHLANAGAYRFGIDQGVALELGGGAPSGLRAGEDVGSDAGSEGRFHMFSKKHDEVSPAAVRRTPHRSFSYIECPFSNVRECSAA